MKRSNTVGTLIVLFSVVSLLASPPASGSWLEDGSLVCSARGWQEFPAMVSDGAKGAIIAWHDMRGGEYRDIYVQRVDSSGVALWAVDGVAASAAEDNQMDPRIVSDGTGGAIMTWRDYRTVTDYDVYAQRVDADGNVMWTEDGEAVCLAPEHQFFPEIASDNAGGAIIAWYDYRNATDANIYAQRLDPSGDTLWVENGVGVCTFGGDQKEVSIVADGSGGAVMAWFDARFKGIYAQRVDADGNALWTADGVAVCEAAGEQRVPRLVSDGAGGAIIVWRDYRSALDFDIYAQRVDAWGNVTWTTDGVPVCSETGHQQDPEIMADGDGGAIMVWQDARFTGIYAQRVDTLGAMSWMADGVPVCTTTGMQRAPELALDGAGGAIITWRDYRGSSYDVYAQRLNASGAPLWTVNGVPICSALDDQRDPKIVSDGVGGAITAWHDYRNIGNYDIYAHRVDANGVTDIVFASASAIGRNGCVVLSWEMGVDVSETSFLIQRGESAEGEFATLSVPVFKSSAHSFTCTDNTVLPRRTYWYRIVLSGSSGEEVYGPIRVYVSPVAVAYRLHQSFPNPFNPFCTIRFEVPHAGPVTLRIFDASGSLVRTLVDGWREAAEYSEIWDGRADDGSAMPSGVYFYELEAGDFEAGKKMVLLR
ncbi:MAG: hypothetical protein AMJ46_11940 [Latescibacteria bacterium DG_63]|nr:MAG: hypothetical protein AMJ46_11940 [Latescibacteria bacterium DG_63]